MNNNSPEGFSLRDFCFVVKLISCRSTCSARGLPQLKFNDLFNQHFLWLIFFLIVLSRKNWQGSGELLNCY